MSCMKYDFTTMIDRKGKDALAVDALGRRPGFGPEPPKEGFDAIPMWVAFTSEFSKSQSVYSYFSTPAPGGPPV